MSNPVPTPLSIPLRGFYFFAYGALGALFPFLPLLLSSRGLSPSSISWVMVVVPLANLVVPPLWGSVADALRARLVLLRVAAVGSGLAALLLLPSWGLGGSILAVAVFSLFRAPLTSLADAAAVDALVGRRLDFSRIRIWGSIGFAVFVYTLGTVGASDRPNTLLGITAVVYVLAAMCTIPLRAPMVVRQPGVATGVWAVLRQPHVVLFLAGNATYYVGHACYDAFFSLHVRRLGYGDGFVGAAWAMGVGAEIGVMLLAPRVLGRIRASLLLSSCAGVAMLRWTGLSLTSSAPAILALQALHGITYGLWYLAMVKFIQTRASDHLRTALQGIASSAIGLGMVAGYLTGGRVFDRYRGQTLFTLATVSAAVALALYAFAYMQVRRTEE